MMSDFLNPVRRQITEFFKKRSGKQNIVLGIIVAVVVAAIVVVASFTGREQYEVLYTGLDESEAGEIMFMLDDMGVTAKAKGSNTILVQSDSADDVRMTLAAQGFPESGLNYDIFAESAALGMTDLQTKTYLQYQLQENLRSTILKLDRIEDCVVIINKPSESLFVLSTDETEATASVMVEVEHGGTLTNEEVQAIANLVFKSVSGLKLGNISIVDSSMNLYDLTEETEEAYTTTQYELTQMTQDTFKQQVLSVLTPVFGADNVSAAVNVSLNFDKETVSSVEFDTPKEDDETGLAVSMEELYELTQGDGNNAAGAAGTDSNGVTIPEYVYQTANVDDFQTISRTVNYELNELQTQIVKQQGTIEKLSVAVLLNSGFSDEDFSASITRLISKAIGVDEEFISVENLPFMDSTEETGISDVFDDQASLMDSLKNKDLIKTLVIAGTVVLLAVVILRFLKTMLHNSSAKQMAVVSAGSGAPAEWSGESGGTDDEALDEITLSGKSKSIEKIESFVNKNPAEAAQLLRNWLLDDSI